MKKRAVSLVDVGKIFIDRRGAGRLYIPKTILSYVNLNHKDRVRLEARDERIVVTSLKSV